MTIAVGFVCRDGVMLCADSLITDGQTKEYGDKVVQWHGKFAGVCFALAGNPAVARIAINDCVAALDEAEEPALSAQRILEIVRPIINANGLRLLGSKRDNASEMTMSDE